MNADRNELRAALAAGLSEMYAAEVPEYGHLVDATARVNAGLGDQRDGARLGTERHGAVRVASFAELTQLAALFSAFGMEAVGFYDLRIAATPIPVVSTAFRPIDPVDMAASPFRMFTSTLVADDERFFSADLGAEVERRVAGRRLLAPELQAAVAAANRDGGVTEANADRFVELAVGAFRLNLEAIDADWHARLDAVSPVASDIAAAAGTHLNHLTPRVGDIVALHALMEAEGVTMIDRIQGPPAWDGPDVLLRQTSFRALDESRTFSRDGVRSEQTVRVRFGEVEQRGVALTPQGRAKVDAAMAAGAAANPGDEPGRLSLIRAELNGGLRPSIAEMAADGDAFALYRRGDGPVPPGDRSLVGLVATGAIEVDPITYEDFLPASAAGIFASNLAHAGAATTFDTVRAADAQRLRAAVGTLHDPYALYAAQQQASLNTTRVELERGGVTLDP